MDVTTHDPSTRREGALQGLCGARALDAVRQGHIWIPLQRPQQIDRRYAGVLRAIYAGLEVRVPNFQALAPAADRPRALCAAGFAGLACEAASFAATGKKILDRAAARRR